LVYLDLRIAVGDARREGHLLDFVDREILRALLANGEVIGRALSYYGRLIGFLDRLVEKSQEEGIETIRAPDSASRAISAHFGVAMMAMSFPAEREPDSFSRGMRGWHSALSPRQVGTNPEGTG
jgi:hypothetical protein